MSDSTISPAAASQLNRECIADKVRLLNRVITKLYDDALAPLDMTVAQMTILVVVAKHGQATPREVGEWLHMEKSTVSRNARRLRSNGWLELVPEPRGRTHRLRLTPKGTKVLGAGMPLWEQAQSKAMSMMGGSGVDELMRIADAVRNPVVDTQ